MSEPMNKELRDILGATLLKRGIPVYNGEKFLSFNYDIKGRPLEGIVYADGCTLMARLCVRIYGPITDAIRERVEQLTRDHCQANRMFAARITGTEAAKYFAMFGNETWVDGSAESAERFFDTFFAFNEEHFPSDI